MNRRYKTAFLLPLLLVAVSAGAQTDSMDAPSPPSAVAQSHSQVRFRVIPDTGAEGNASVTQPLAETLASLGARPASVAEVNTWSDRLTQALRQGGFPISQVLMTEADWQAAQRGGEYVFSVFPGRIGRIEVKNTSRVDDARLQRLISNALCDTDTLEAGEACLLQTARLERATQLLQDVPGVGMAGAPRFSAGQGVGDAQVEFGLVEKGEPVQVGVVVDNGGIATTGRTRAGVSVSGNNVFHAGDAYSLTLMDTRKGARTGSVSASTPLGYSGLRLAGSATRQQYTVNAVTPIAGMSTVYQAGVQYPFTRGLDSNVWGGLWLLHNRSESKLTDYGVTMRSTIKSAQMSLQADNGDRAAQLRTNRWNVYGALTFGKNSNNNSNDVVTKRAGDYAKFTGRAFGTYGLDASGDLFISGQIAGQIANRNLDSSEQLFMGGPGAVRAYRADEGSVDEGAIVNLGLYRRFPVATGHQLQVGAFTDLSYGRVNHAPWTDWEKSYANVPGVRNTRKLSGYGLSVDWLTPVGVTVSLAAARPFGFSPSSWVEPGKKPSQYWLSVSWSH